MHGSWEISVENQFALKDLPALAKSHQRRLAATRWPQEADELAARHRQRNIPDDRL